MDRFRVFKLEEVAAVSAGGDKPTHFSNIQTPECSVPVFANGETNDGLQGFTKFAKITEHAVTVSARGIYRLRIYREKPG